MNGSVRARTRRRRWGIVLLCFAGMILATAVIGRFVSTTPASLMQAALISSLGYPPPPSTTSKSVTYFADEFGFPVSKPRDSIRVTVEWWKPEVLKEDFAPAWLEVETVTVRMDHNGLNGTVAGWTPLPDAEVCEILRQHRPQILNTLGEYRLFDATSPDRFITPEPRTTPVDRLVRIKWPNIAVNVLYTMHRPWLSMAVGTMLGVGAMLLISSRAPRFGCCDRCGYDLRATPADKPCPECGNTSKAPEVTP